MGRLGAHTSPITGTRPSLAAATLFWIQAEVASPAKLGMGSVTRPDKGSDELHPVLLNWVGWGFWFQEVKLQQVTSPPHLCSQEEDAQVTSGVAPQGCSALLLFSVPVQQARKSLAVIHQESLDLG